MTWCAASSALPLTCSKSTPAAACSQLETRDCGLTLAYHMVSGLRSHSPRDGPLKHARLACLYTRLVQVERLHPKQCMEWRHYWMLARLPDESMCSRCITAIRHRLVAHPTGAGARVPTPAASARRQLPELRSPGCIVGKSQTGNICHQHCLPSVRCHMLPVLACCTAFPEGPGHQLVERWLGVMQAAFLVEAAGGLISNATPHRVLSVALVRPRRGITVAPAPLKCAASRLEPVSAHTMPTCDCPASAAYPWQCADVLVLLYTRSRTAAHLVLRRLQVWRQMQVGREHLQCQHLH